jgi:hypothetical protein
MDETQDQTVSKTHEDAPDGAFAVGFPLPESNSATPEAPTNASSEWESNQVSRLATEQPPLTRSKTPQTIEFNDISEPPMAGFGMCDTNLYHILPSDCGLNTYNYSIKSKSACSTQLIHNQRVRGLWRRGSTFQYRVRVPIDLKPVMGCSHNC